MPAPELWIERANKGSLEPGKLADLVAFDRNLPEVDPMQIRKIDVVALTPNPSRGIP